MKTILDIKIPDQNNSKMIYSINSYKDIFAAIEDCLVTNPISNQIYVKLHIDVSIQHIEHNLGFNYNNIGKPVSIGFRDYQRWVYFKNDIPVWFDSAGCMTDTPSHLCGFAHDIYKTLDYDRVEKIKF